jgi:hypothetical protein
MDSRTQWSSKVVESFSSNTQEHLNDPEPLKEAFVAEPSQPILINTNSVVGKNADEGILRGTRLPTDGSGNEEPEDESITSQIRNFFKGNNWTKFGEIWKKAVKRMFHPNQTAPDGESYPWRKFVDTLLPIFWVDPDTEEGRKYSRMMSNQIQKWWVAFMACIIVINWWYLWNYTDFTVDFRSWTPSVFGWIFEPAFYSMELINYYIVGIRLDANPYIMFLRPETIRETFRSMWNNRPFTFALFYVCVVGTLGAWMSGISDMMEAILLGNPTSVAMLIPIAALVYFFLKNFTLSRLYKYQTMAPFPVLGPVILLVFTFILSIIAAAGFGPAIFAAYMFYISYFSIAIFTFPGLSLSLFTWPWTIIREYLRIYHDLSEAPVSDPETTKLSGQVGNFLFQEFHNLIIFFFVALAIFIQNMKEMGEVLSPNDPMLYIFIILINIFMLFVVSTGLSTTLSKLYVLFWNVLKSIVSMRPDLPTKGIDEQL